MRSPSTLLRTGSAEHPEPVQISPKADMRSLAEHPVQISPKAGQGAFLFSTVLHRAGQLLEFEVVKHADQLAVVAVLPALLGRHQPAEIEPRLLVRRADVAIEGGETGFVRGGSDGFFARPVIAVVPLLANVVDLVVVGLAAIDGRYFADLFLGQVVIEAVTDAEREDGGAATAGNGREGEE
jgi:hypothetical protein